MLKKFLFVLLTVLIGTSYGQNKVGTTVAQFLKIGVGSRASGMGEAYVAMSNDASGLYWNPAGIALAPHGEFMFVHTPWLADIFYVFVGIIAFLNGVGTFCASVTSLGMPDMPVRTEYPPQGTGEYFSASDLAIQVSFARSLTDRFSIGLNAKFIQERIWHMSANGMDVDVGTLFRTQFHDMRLGMSISNFGTSMRMSGRDALIQYDADPNINGNNDRIPAYLALDDWALPLIFRVGIALDIWQQGSSKLTVAVDALHPNDNFESLNLGTELNIANIVFVRAGWKSPFVETNSATNINNWEQREESFTAGAGVDIPMVAGTGLKLDYSFSDFGRLKNAQRFTLNFYF